MAIIDSRKRKIRLLSIGFAALLIICTMLGNTIMALTLPKVVVTTAREGELTHSFQASAVLHWAVEADLAGDAGRKVAQVHVKKGEAVRKGQLLLTYDTNEAKERILEEQAALQKLQLAREGEKAGFYEAAQSGDEKLIAEAKRLLKLSEIDLKQQQRKIGQLQQQLSANRMLTAPFDGIVVQVNLQEGMASTGAGYEVRLARRELGVQFEFAAPPEQADLLAIGEVIEVWAKREGAQQFEGKIEAIEAADHGDETTASSQNKRVKVTLQDERLHAGERVEVRLERKTADVLLLPNNAIHSEGEDRYVWTIETRDGPLGNAFYVRKTAVTVLDASDTESAISEGLFAQEQVILESSEPLLEGERIRMP